jgi:hypothetical protein
MPPPTGFESIVYGLPARPEAAALTVAAPERAATAEGL